MAAGSLLALLDDIATILDDVATLTKVATEKTAGVLGDDLALNAQQVAGVNADRELPVVWAVAKGSLKNKAILVPLALGISAVAPWLILPMLMIGGAYLCFEGFEKVAHKLLHDPEEEAHDAALKKAVADPAADLVALEQEKIKGAIRTDFILSAEIVVIALGTVAEAEFSKQVIVVVGLSVLLTFGVYGLVAGIVKLDDVGFWLQRRGPAARSVGRLLLWIAPRLMKSLSVIGTVAMFLVGGSILLHGLGPIAHWVEAQTAELHGVAAWAVGTLADLVVGVVSGGLVLAIVTVGQKLWKAVRRK